MNKTVLVVDDHLLVSKALKMLIESYEGFKVVEVLTNGKELVDYYGSNRDPDIVLLDVRMPVMDGLQTMDWLKRNRPTQKVMVLTMDDEETCMILMLRRGASGYVKKSTEPEHLIMAMEMILEKGYYHSEILSHEMELGRAEELSSLSAKEMEFLQLTCTELTYREIADKIGRSPKTIDGYRESLFEKLGVKSRTGLVLFAIRHKIVSF